MFRICNVCDQNTILAAAKAGTLQIIFSFCSLVYLHLENTAFTIPRVEIENFQVFDISVISRSLGKKFVCHNYASFFLDDFILI